MFPFAKVGDPMKITLSLLVSLDACAEQRDAFAAAFPDGLNVSGDPPPDTIERIVSAGLSVGWLAGRVLTAPAWAEYERVTAPAWAEYERVAALAWAEYERVTAPAWAEYERVTALAWAECERGDAQALAEYGRVDTQALAEYKRVTDPAFAEYERAKVTALWHLLTDPKNVLTGMR